MADQNQTPTAPPGFSPVQTQSAPTAPPGFSPVASTPPASEGATGVGGVLSGIGGGVIGLAEGGIKLANKVLPSRPRSLTDVIENKPAEGLIPDIPKEYYEERTPSEKAGGVLEDIGEFAAGGEALEGLEGLAKATKMVKLARQYPLIADTLKLAEEHKVLAKIISEGAKSAVVGGAQGAVKGATEGKAKEEAIGGAEGGAIGGALGGAVVEAATPLAKAVAEKFGIGTEAGADAARGIRPGKRNYRFADDFLKAAPLMDAENSINPAKTVEDWADKTQDAREKLYTNEIKPLVDKYATQPLDTLNLQNKVRTPPKFMRGEEVKKMEEIANDFAPGQKFDQLPIGDAEEALQHYNAELAATGFWSKMPSEREALLKTNGTVAGYKAAADALRDELYGRLDALEPGSGMQELKRTYGALRNVEDEIRGRINVNNRQVPISLKETIGLITGLGHGGPVGAIMAGLPILDRFGNAPENLITRGVEKAVGKEGAVSRGVQAVGRAAAGGTPTLAGAAGAGVGQNLPELMPGWSRVQDSAGNVHDLPTENLGKLQVRDPSIKILASENPVKMEE